MNQGVPFQFHQTGAYFIKDGMMYRIPRRFQTSQTRRAGIDYKIVDGYRTLRLSAIKPTQLMPARTLRISPADIFFVFSFGILLFTIGINKKERGTAIMTNEIIQLAEQCGTTPEIAEQIIQAGISEFDFETVRRVLETAKENGIKKNPHVLGILYSEESEKGITHPFFVLILEAFRKAAEAHGYDMVFLNKTPLQEGETWLERSRKSGADGVCIVCADFEDPAIKELAESGFPCVTIDHIYRRVSAIISDNENGICSLVEYAIRQGHKRIAFVHGHKNSVVTETRIEQFKNVMKYHSLPVPDEYIREGLYHDIQLTRSIVTDLLSMPERPTCILLPDDMTYLGAQEAARELGLSIPRDISFAGYDGIPLAQALDPKLTTVRQGVDEMGSTAAERLVALIEDPKPTLRIPVIFPVELEEGGTVGSIS